MKVFLPGLKKQIDLLFPNYKAPTQRILVVGSSSEWIAQQLAKKYKCNVDLIVSDYDSLMNSKIILEGDETVTIRIMDFDATDFQKEQFDLIYAQGSVSFINRNKIIKEFKRILKPNAYLCLGEITALEKVYPVFIKDIFDNSSLLPIYSDEIEKYYEDRNFEIIYNVDISYTLKDYYLENATRLNQEKDNLTSNEKSYYKKLLNKISHESNVYLKLGGDQYIGFSTLLLRKIAN
jgi:SAM-dependent methyltransferase